MMADGRSFPFLAMLQENGFDVGVKLQNANEFDATIPAMSDDADLNAQCLNIPLYE
jgi:hypothetical protein